MIADPQFTVTLPNDGTHSLCYEVHGDAGKFFNLVSDTCLSVNAYFTSMPDTIMNRMSRIGIHAVPVGITGCVDIEIEHLTCSAMLNGVAVNESVTTIIGGIRLRKMGNSWRVSVPNCELPRPSVVMRVTCMPTRLRFDVTRGSNLHPSSHGLLGEMDIHRRALQSLLSLIFL